MDVKPAVNAAVPVRCSAAALSLLCVVGLAVFIRVGATDAIAAQMTSASCTATGGHFNAGGSGAMTSTAPVPVFAGANEVWTGTLGNGTAANAGDANTHCNGFTANATYTGAYGADQHASNRWSYFDLLPTKSCSQQKRIYCFRQ
jgi:hypothetical protein